MHENQKHIPIPDPGDDIPGAWDAYDRTVGTIMPTDPIGGYELSIQYVTA